LAGKRERKKTLGCKRAGSDALARRITEIPIKEKKHARNEMASQESSSSAIERRPQRSDIPDHAKERRSRRRTKKVQERGASTTSARMYA